MRHPVRVRVFTFVRGKRRISMFPNGLTWDAQTVIRLMLRRFVPTRRMRQRPTWAVHLRDGRCRMMMDYDAMTVREAEAMFRRLVRGGFRYAVLRRAVGGTFAAAGAGDKSTRRGAGAGSGVR